MIINDKSELQIDEGLLLEALSHMSQKGYLKVLRIKGDEVHIRFTDKSIERFGMVGLTKEDLAQFKEKSMIIKKEFIVEKALEMFPRLRQKHQT